MKKKIVVICIMLLLGTNFSITSAGIKLSNIEKESIIQTSENIFSANKIESSNDKMLNEINIKELRDKAIKEHNQLMSKAGEFKYIPLTDDLDMEEMNKMQREDPSSELVFYDSEYAIVGTSTLYDLIKITLTTGCECVDIIPRLFSGLFKMKEGMSPEEFIGIVEPMGEVEFAELNTICTINMIPDDPYFEYQWGLKAIRCPEAWDITLGGLGIGTSICILDTGIDKDHADRGGIGIGPDYVDDDDFPDDWLGHGTHCAGTISATINNGKGIASVADKCHIQIIKVCGPQGAPRWDIAKGIVHSILVMGNGINSISLGGERPSILEGLACLFSLELGVLTVASAGNEGKDTPSYPAGYASVMAVGAVDRDLKICDWSNRGVDIVAPGEDIWSTWINGGYACKDGTSMAAPHVAAVAGLILSRLKLPSCHVRYMLLMKYLLGKAKKLGPIEEYGHGLVDAYASVTLTNDIQNYKTINSANNNYFLNFLYFQNPQNRIINLSNKRSVLTNQISEKYPTCLPIVK